MNNLSITSKIKGLGNELNTIVNFQEEILSHLYNDKILKEELPNEVEEELMIFFNLKELNTRITMVLNSIEKGELYLG